MENEPIRFKIHNCGAMCVRHECPSASKAKQLIVSIYLDKATSAANIHLDVSDQLMVINLIQNQMGDTNLDFSCHTQ